MNIEIETIDLKRIENRLATFDNWPVRFIDKNDLARAGIVHLFLNLLNFSIKIFIFLSKGFYYLNNSDQVRCIECKGVIGRWEEGDIPFIEHRKFFPDCPIVRQNDLLNEEIGIQPVISPKYPEYSTLESRVRSFSTWTLTVQDPSILAQAGFYYLGSGDEVCN